MMEDNADVLGTLALRETTAPAPAALGLTQTNPSGWPTAERLFGVVYVEEGRDAWLSLVPNRFKAKEHD